MTDIRLLFCIDSLSFGGAERSLLQMAPRLIDAGIDLHVLLQHPSIGDLVEQAKMAGCTLHDLGGSGGRRVRLRGTLEVIDRVRPDLVHTTLAESDLIGRSAALWRRMAVTSSVVNLSYDDDHYRGVPSSRRLRVFQVLDARTARRCRAIHAVSESVARSASATLGVPPSRVEVIPRSRDLADFPPTDRGARSKGRSALGVPDDRPLFICVASHETRKGIDRLLRAWPMLVNERPGSMLVLLGRSGSATAELTDLVRDLGLAASVRFVDPVTAVAPMLHAADVFVLPSRREGFPGAVIEALAVGLPVVGAEIGPIREVVGDVLSAEVVDAEDPGTLAGSLSRALERPGPHLDAIARARSFDVDEVADAMSSFFYRHAHGPDRGPISRTRE